MRARERKPKQVARFRSGVTYYVGSGTNSTEDLEASRFETKADEKPFAYERSTKKYRFVHRMRYTVSGWTAVREHTCRTSVRL